MMAYPAKWPGSMAALLAVLAASSCSAPGDEGPLCPRVSLLKGVERAELSIGEGQSGGDLELRLGPVTGSCYTGDAGRIELTFSFDIIASNSSAYDINGLSADYFIAVLQKGSIIDKNEFAASTFDVAAGGVGSAVETVEQVIMLSPDETAGDYQVLVGFALPSDVGLNQLRQQ